MQATADPHNGSRLVATGLQGKYACAAAHRHCSRGRELCQSHLSVAWDKGFVKEMLMNRIIYIVGFVVIVIFVLGFLGLR